MVECYGGYGADLLSKNLKSARRWIDGVLEQVKSERPEIIQHIAELLRDCADRVRTLDPVFRAHEFENLAEAADRLEAELTDQGDKVVEVR